MKKIALLFSLVIISFFCVNGQTTPAATPPPAPTNPNAPVITFEKMVYDYGTIQQKANGACEFKFTNTGKEPLILTTVRPSCGCTIADYPKEPILPGKSGVIKVGYNTNNAGSFQKTITVNSNAKNAEVTLTIKGNVQEAPKQVAPEKPVNEQAVPVAK